MTERDMHTDGGSYIAALQDEDSDVRWATAWALSVPGGEEITRKSSGRRAGAPHTTLYEEVSR
jgi:hypothetical protein